MCLVYGGHANHSGSIQTHSRNTDKEINLERLQENSEMQLQDVSRKYESILFVGSVHIKNHI